MEDYIKKLDLIFGTLFFVMMGTFINPMDAMSINPSFLALVFVVSVASDLVACALPAGAYFRDLKTGCRVGLSMAIGGGGEALIIAGSGRMMGLLTRDVYASLVIAVMMTVVIIPVLLRRLFGERPAEPST